MLGQALASRGHQGVVFAPQERDQTLSWHAYLCLHCRPPSSRLELEATSFPTRDAIIAALARPSSHFLLGDSLDDLRRRKRVFSSFQMLRSRDRFEMTIPQRIPFLPIPRSLTMPGPRKPCTQETCLPPLNTPSHRTNRGGKMSRWAKLECGTGGLHSQLDFCSEWLRKQNR